MAINFKLFDNYTGQPVSPITLDENICKEVLNCEPHPKFYGGIVFNWFDTIGYMLASGMRLQDGENSVRSHYQQSEIWKEELPIIEKIIDYLQTRYIEKSWVSIGK